MLGTCFVVQYFSVIYSFATISLGKCLREPVALPVGWTSDSMMVPT